MSHYEVKFTGSNHEKEAQALRECESYLGTTRFNKIVKSCRKSLKGVPCRKAYRELRFALPFAGIQGYWPVRAFFRYLRKGV